MPNRKKILLVLLVGALVLMGVLFGARQSLPEKDTSRNEVALQMERTLKEYLKVEKPYSDLLQALKRNQVDTLGITMDGELLVREKDQNRYYVHMPAPQGLLTDALTKIAPNEVVIVSLRAVAVARNKGPAAVVLDGVKDLLPLVIIVFLVLAARGMAGGMGKDATYNRIDKTDVRFDDIIGAEDAKEALQDVVAYLKDPELFARIGARAPKGVLMEGPPGTGKTLLAKAVAGECSVPFYSLNGASFSSPFVGMGIMKVRKLFKEAAAHAPCIVFIDELDGIGNRDSGGRGDAASTENSRIINTILTELDGFEAQTGVVVIGATNYASRVDAALTREGRFDRKCLLGLPSIEERQKLFALYAKKINVSDNVDWTRLSRLSAGLAPSAISAVVNAAALAAAQRGSEEVTAPDLATALERQQMGAPTASIARGMSESLKRRIATHEAGHAVIGDATGMGTLDGVTIVPRSRALGVTLLTQDQDSLLFTGTELRAQICTLLAGRAAEKLMLGEASTGAANDLDRASRLALHMVADTGLAGRFGAFSFKALGPESETLTRAEALPDAVKLLEELEAETDRILVDNQEALAALTEALLDRETLTGEEAKAIISSKARRYT
jgi:cell division protease FtsH